MLDYIGKCRPTMKPTMSFAKHLSFSVFPPAKCEFR